MICVFGNRLARRTLQDITAHLFIPFYNPDTNLYDIFRWGYVKYQLFVPTTAKTDIDKFKTRISATIRHTRHMILKSMILKVLSCHRDTVLVFEGAHIKHCVELKFLHTTVGFYFKLTSRFQSLPSLNSHLKLVYSFV